MEGHERDPDKLLSHSIDRVRGPFDMDGVLPPRRSRVIVGHPQDLASSPCLNRALIRELKLSASVAMRRPGPDGAQAPICRSIHLMRCRDKPH
jgi:hypothetical protein